MKHRKNLLRVFMTIVVAFAIQMTAFAQTSIAINSKNFPDPAFRKFLREETDFGRDGVITSEELKNVTEIYFSELNVRSIKGIEFFTELKLLQASECQITDIDLSHNTKLEQLHVDYNKLTKLDLTHNTQLKQLYCSDNRLTSLDLSPCPKLYVVLCDNNKLTRLDLSHNPKLTRISCIANSLTTLDLSPLPLLEDLSCSANRLTKLDVSHNLRINNISCSGNYIGADAMSAFVNGLPLNTAGKNNSERPYLLYVYSNDPDPKFKDHNVFNSSLAAIAKAKGWRVSYWDSKKNGTAYY